MSQVRKKSGQFIVPGERLGVIEEFTPGPGTYVERGVVYSQIVGRALLDIMNKRVSVYPLARAASIPRTGSIVTGQVSNVQSKRAMVHITKIGKRTLTGAFTGLLHISEVSQGFIETMYDACKTGDIVRAKVVSNKNRTYQLSTADRTLGIVYAFCSTCGGTLSLKGRNMRCTKCGKIESRKVALDYGRGAM